MTTETERESKSTTYAYHAVLPLMVVDIDGRKKPDGDIEYLSEVQAESDSNAYKPLVRIEICCPRIPVARACVGSALEMAAEQLQASFATYERALESYDNAPERLTSLYEKLSVGGKRQLLEEAQAIARHHEVQFDDEIPF